MAKKIELKTFGDVEDAMKLVKKKYGENFTFNKKEYSCYPTVGLYCPTTGVQHDHGALIAILKKMGYKVEK